MFKRFLRAGGDNIAKRVGTNFRIRSLLVAAAISMFLVDHLADAATITWGNSATDFNANGSWVGGIAPGTADIAAFSSATTSFQPNVTANKSVLGLSFTTAGWDLTSSSPSIQLTLLSTNTAAGSAAITATNSSGTNTIDAPLVLGASSGTQTFSQASGGILKLNGIISSAAAVQLRLTGGGIFELNGANTYTGGTSISASGETLRINNASALGTGALTLANSATLDNTSGSAITLTTNNALIMTNGSLTFTGTNDLNFGTGAVTIGGSTKTFTITANTFTLGGNVGESGLTNLTKAGAGTLVLNGTGGTYTGKTSINGGTLSINSIKNLSASSSIGAPTTAANGTIDIGNTSTGATLKYTGSGDTTNRVINLAGSSGGATLDQSGTGLLKFTSDFTAAGGNKTLTLQGSTAGTGEVAGKIVGNNVNVAKSGTGTWTLSGANTYGGTTTVNQGTLTAGVGSLVSVGSGITVNGGGTLLLSGTGRHIGSGVTVTLGGGTFNTGGLSEPGGTVDGTNFIGALSLTATSTIDFGTGSSSILEFAGLGTHTASTILNVIDWDGVPVVGGSGDRLLFNGLIADFIGKYNQSDVTFDGVTGYTAIQIATGANPFYEVVGLAAVPEPSTWLAGGLACAAVLFTQRRRFCSK